MNERDYPSRPFLAVSTAVLRGDHVLIARRAAAPGADVYSLPGGVVELGETLEAAALRELDEEVAVTADIIGLCNARDVIIRDDEGRIARHFAVITFAARWREGEGTRSPEATDVQWVTLETLSNYPTTVGLSDVIAKAFRVAKSS